MIYVYILYSALLQKRYVGITADLIKRLKYHNEGLSRWTKRGVPWQLIYYESYINKKDAHKRERFLKSGRGREVIDKQLRFTLERVAKAVPPIRRI